MTIFLREILVEDVFGASQLPLSTVSWKLFSSSILKFKRFFIYCTSYNTFVQHLTINQSMSAVYLPAPPPHPWTPSGVFWSGNNKRVSAGSHPSIFQRGAMSGILMNCLYTLTDICCSHNRAHPPQTSYPSPHPKKFIPPPYCRGKKDSFTNFSFTYCSRMFSVKGKSNFFWNFTISTTSKKLVHIT